MADSTAYNAPRSLTVITRRIKAQLALFAARHPVCKTAAALRLL
jgi:hypothetical protein